MKTLEISVIIPAYKAADFLEKAVLSAVTFSEVKEIIIIEDGSPDATLSVAQSLAKKYPKVVVYQHPDQKNHGDSASRNLGIEKTKYSYIAFLDADDYFLPNRFDAEKELFKHQKIDAVFGATGTEFLTEEGEKLYMEKFKNDGLCTVHFAAEGKEIFHRLVEEQNTFGASFSMIALTMKRSALENPKIRMTETLKIGMDKEFIIKMAYHKHMKTGLIDQPISVRTAHGDNTITKIKTYSKSFFEHDAKLYKSLYLWAKSEKNFPKEEKQIFKSKYLASEIASETGITKYLKYLYYLPSTPRLLKTRYRYFALKNNPE